LLKIILLNKEARLLASCSSLKRGRNTDGQMPLPVSTRIHRISAKVKWGDTREEIV